MKVLVLGGTGYIGSRLCALLADTGWATPVSASSRRNLRGVESVQVDTVDAQALAAALRGIDAVVNCVAGSADAIARGAQVLAAACADAGCRRIVHLSSMSVYGHLEGEVDEDSPIDATLGWYAKAKCEAEQHIAAFAGHPGNTAIVLRPGCVTGPGSELWVGRIGRLLRARRLGDLGVAGDGWSNLVHADDVCAAIIASLRTPEGALRCYNLAAPGSPRWNDYFVDLGVAIGATPVPRLSRTQLRMDAMLVSPPLKALQMVLGKAGISPRAIPDPLPPNLLGLWERHLHLDSQRAGRELGIRWTPYAEVLKQSAAWFVREHASRLPETTLAALGKDVTP